jgi:hypothetical protein
VQKQNNLKILVNVLPSYLDYDEPFANAGEDFRKICGWSGGDGKLSQINLTKFAQHLRATLDAVKAANLTIDAFEIGNEFDTTCYDADVPVGHAASEKEIVIWLRGYGEFLKAAALVNPRSQLFSECQDCYVRYRPWQRSVGQAMASHLSPGCRCRQTAERKRLQLFGE